MNRHGRTNLFLMLAAAAVTLLLCELGVRALIQPAELSHGTLFGRDLPPLRLVPGPEVPAYDPSSPYGQPTADGLDVALGDVFGHFRTDPVLTYTYQEDVISANGWWQSNNLGARARFDAERPVPAGRKRILVFGESFAHGSRVPQEDAWPSIMDDTHGELEVLNFAVDGYSMGQSLLRYQLVRPELDYDVVLLMFVPDADLWRDINLVRDLADPGWGNPIVMPRFILNEDRLTLVPPFYTDPFDVYPENADGISAGLHEHLQRYDRYYYPARHRVPPVIGSSTIYKVGVEARWSWKRRRLSAGLMDPAGEALQVSRAIFGRIAEQAAADGALFALAVLPVDHGWREMPATRAWQELVSFVCVEGIHCIDLLEPLGSVAVEDIDYALDGQHYGPRMNGRIAAAISEALEGLLPEGTAMESPVER